MKNVLLLCSTGLSTSLLVNKLRRTCEERGLNLNIWATSSGFYRDDALKADVILLGPQVKFMMREVKKIVNDKPIDVISSSAYRTINSQAIIEQILNLIEQ